MRSLETPVRAGVSQLRPSVGPVVLAGPVQAGFSAAPAPPGRSGPMVARSRWVCPGVGAVW